MQISSQLAHHNQAIIPELVMEALSQRDGDAIVFEIDQAGVHLRKAPPIDTAFTDALQGTLSEWNYAVDDEPMLTLQSRKNSVFNAKIMLDRNLPGSSALIA